MQHPTLLFYGSSPDQNLLNRIQADPTWGFVMDNGRARDVVFTIYENLARADAIIALPSAHPVHLVSLIAEAEVGHPLIVQDPAAPGHPEPKPIIFCGSTEQWKGFKELFAPMRREGLLREGFDRTVHYAATTDQALTKIESLLPSAIQSTRIHYYLHSKKSADLEVDLKSNVRPPSDITVACFGSASTKNPAHLERTDLVARFLAKSNYNILHGGGTSGVMGQLSTSAAKYKAFVLGVTVHSSGAPKIFFERADGNNRPEDVDLQIASKDMLHRIETYAGHSHAFVALDGGIGTIQEILVIAELLAQSHPVMHYEDSRGAVVKKPLFLLNEAKIYDGLLSYLTAQGFGHLTPHIRIVETRRELEQGLEAHFREHRPRGYDIEQNHRFRERYGNLPAPMTPTRFPDLSTLIAAPAAGRDLPVPPGTSDPREHGSLQP